MGGRGKGLKRHNTRLRGAMGTVNRMNSTLTSILQARVSLTGQSAGGGGAWRFAATRPRLWAAAPCLKRKGEGCPPVGQLGPTCLTQTNCVLSFGGPPPTPPRRHLEAAGKSISTKGPPRIRFHAGRQSKQSRFMTSTYIHIHMYTHIDIYI